MAKQRKLNGTIPKKNSLAEFRGISTTQQMADAVGVDKATWSRWETGASFPSVPYIFRIEELTGKSYRDIWAKACLKLDGLRPE